MALLHSVSALSTELSDPTQFMFVGDRSENLIDIVSIADEVVVHRIETTIHADHIIATPYAPILVYFNIEEKKATFYDLSKKVEIANLDLPLSPRHVVLDTTGAKIGVSDSTDGGFALIHVFKMAIDFSLREFPPSAEVLFDPNDIDIYFTNSAAGTIGVLDSNTRRIHEVALTESENQNLSAPSRSLDARYLYVSNRTTGEVYSINAYSHVVFKVFYIGGSPARPYTTPQGTFLYMMDAADGRLISVDQHLFSKFADAKLEHPAEFVVVGRFDRMNLLLSSTNSKWSLFDNRQRAITTTGDFDGRPLMGLGSADGKTGYIAFSDRPHIAAIDLENQTITYIEAADNGVGAFTIGLSNNVCH